MRYEDHRAFGQVGLPVSRDRRTLARALLGGHPRSAAIAVAVGMHFAAEFGHLGGRLDDATADRHRIWAAGDMLEAALALHEKNRQHLDTRFS